MKKLNTFIYLILFPILYNAQDSYHLDLINRFVSENNLPQPSYIFHSTETENISSSFSFGSITKSNNDVQDLDFTKSTNIKVTSAGNNPWDSGYGLRSKNPVLKDDILLITFWARKINENSDLKLFVEDGTSFEKDFYENINLVSEWKQFLIAVKASKDYPANELSVGFHLASVVQELDLGGLTGFNFGQIDIDDVPSSFATGAYEGIEDDAPWRAEAASRIEEIRMADLNLVVKNMDGSFVNDAEVRVEMIEHDFKFGSALVGCRTPGASCFDETYISKLNDLDGKGHRFNYGVLENEMKWDGWEEEWFGSPSQTEGAVRYYNDIGMPIRGHTLFWTGFQYFPDDISENQNDYEYIRTRIDQRIDEMINNPDLMPLVREWDVLNEITQNRDLENIFKSDPNFTSGREIYQEIIKKVKAIDPDLKLYVNDYIVLSGGGAGSTVVERYKQFLDELNNSDAPFDGIGFQGHIGTNPTSILKVKSTFDEFYERYGKRMSVTEYDINKQVDPEVQAKYMEDFLTITFSHPSMDAFLMWGFWDGNHWKDNAPMFDINWNLKPSGQAFLDKVYDEWWTDESAMTNEEGLASLRVFKGKHKITVSKGDRSIEMEVNLVENETFEINLDGSSSIDDLVNDGDFNILPNLISEGYFVVETTDYPKIEKLDIYAQSGRLISSHKNLKNGDRVNVDMNPGMYFVSVQVNKGRLLRKIVVE